MPDINYARIRHEEHREFEVIWQHQYDAWEAGHRYRNATYGKDSLQQDVYNLVRHKSEYPDPNSAKAGSGTVVGQDVAFKATLDDFEFRRARTPVPAFTREAVERHLAKIWAKEVLRDTPEKLIKDWWENVDGRRTKINRWISKTIAPLVMNLACLDLVFDHPVLPEGEEVKTDADRKRLKLDACIAGYILPQNTTWWRLDQAGRYLEVVVRECKAEGDTYRRWTAKDWTLYDARGDVLKGPVAHPFGRVPIVRVFDQRLPRCENVGKLRYADIAEYQREYYNRDSESVVHDTNQSHSIVQGPIDFIKPDSTIFVGPNRVLPKAKVQTGTSTTYEGWDVVDFPQGGADSLRASKSEIRDNVDRSALLTKPAGAAGTTGTTVAQSGISKRLDQNDGNNLLTEIAEVLASVERDVHEFAYVVLTDGKDPEPFLKSLQITYPKVFDLYFPEELLALFVGFQDALAAAGNAPIVEAAVLQQIIRLMLPGRAKDEYEPMDKEIQEAIEAKADQLAKEQEATLAMKQAMAESPADPNDPNPPAEAPKAPTMEELYAD